MAMQESGKGAASGSAPNPALSEEQADQFAASFTPAWDTGDEGALGDSTNGTAEATLANTLVMESAPKVATAGAAPPIVGSPIVMTHKSTMIGTAPQANVPTGAPPMRAAISSAEVIDPANVLDIQTAPQPNVAAARPAPPAPPPAPAAAQAPGINGRTLPLAQPAMTLPQGARSGGAAPAARAAPAVAPFRAPAPSDDLDLVPKKSSKTIILVVGGLLVAAAVGLGVKFGTGDDTPKTPAQQTVGPAVTTADIPPPPPKVDTPPPTPAKTAEPAAAAATTTQPSTAVIAPVRAPDPPQPPPQVAPRLDPPVQRPPVQHTRPAVAPPPAAAPPPAPPKTPPKGPDRGIVRDNPF